MTRPSNGPRVPGGTLLKIAPLLFTEHFVATVVEPTIADFQAEFAAAGTSRVRRFRARWRGYHSLLVVTLIAPFASWTAVDADGHASARGGAGRVALFATAFAILALCRALLGVSVAVVGLAAAMLLAIVIHVWYERHPSETPSPVERTWRPPQINFSSMEVAGNVGGLIFAVGSVLVVAVGLPWVRWFLLAASVAGCILAWALAAWHKRHPSWGVPENRIVLR